MKNMAGHKKTYIASGIVVLTGLLFTITAFAGSGWAEPSSAAVPSPVPLSSEGMQAKQGGITVGSLYASVAQFNQQLFIAGTIKSDTGILHLNTTTGTGVVVSANLKASGILQADSIKNDSGAAPLCANSAGTVVLCDIVATVTLLSLLLILLLVLIALIILLLLAGLLAMILPQKHA